MVERCDKIEDRDKHLEQLKTKLEDRNYPPELIKKKFETALGKDRKELIHQQRRKKYQQDGKVRLMITQNQTNPPIHQWVRNCRKVLLKNEKAKALGSRIQICTKQPRNLQRIAGGYKGESGGSENVPPDAGCQKCNHCKVACPILQEGKSFQSTNTQKNTKSDRSSLVTVTGSSILVHAKNVLDSMLVNPKQNLKLDIQTTSKRLRTRPWVLATTMEGWGLWL